MKCPKCNHALPADSEFCQYCGTRIEKQVMTPVAEKREELAAVVEPPAPIAKPVVESPAPKAPKQPTPVEENIVVAADAEEPTQLPDFEKMTSDEALSAILQVQAKNAVEAMEANSKTQPNNEGDADFGLVPEKPIFTLAMMSVDGEKEYLNLLYTANGEKLRYNRLGSTSVEGINGMIDIYETFLPNGQPYKTIYINMYGAKRSTKAPAGFVLNTPTIQPRPGQKREKPVKTKYCSRCGSVVDNKTKVCTGCGKKYFKGLRFTKFSITVMVLTFVIVLISTLSVFQYINIREVNRELKDEISYLERGMSIKQSVIEQYERRVDSLEDEISDLRIGKVSGIKALDFYERYAALVNENSKKYHKYGCEDFDKSSFWIYSITAAEQKGYYACPKCH